MSSFISNNLLKCPNSSQALPELDQGLKGIPALVRELKNGRNHREKNDSGEKNQSNFNPLSRLFLLNWVFPLF